MQRTTRRVLMVVFVATALSADRMVAAAPQVKPQAARVTARFTTRLVQSFRRTIPANQLCDLRQVAAVQVIAEAVEASDNQAIVWVVSTPFEDRLPPPAL
jgi:hypothetical protein